MLVLVCCCSKGRREHTESDEENRHLRALRKEHTKCNTRPSPPHAQTNKLTMSYVPPDGDTASEGLTGISPVNSIECTEHHTNVHISKGDTSSPYDNIRYTSASNAPVLAMEGSQPPNDYIHMDWRNDDKDEQGDDDDHHEDDKTIISSILTADGIHDITGFSIVCFVILIGDMSRGVMWPTLWPLVSELGGTTVTLGYAVAAFSFGRIIVSPLFGHWSVLYGYSKVLVLSCGILFLGTLAYAQAQNVGSTSFLIFAQSLLGVGSGTLGVTRAFVAEVTATRTRTRYMMWITAVQYGGFTVTPFFGALFINILGDADYRFGYVWESLAVVVCFCNGVYHVLNTMCVSFFPIHRLFRLNMYTAPAYFMGIICLITLALLAIFFQDRTRLKTVSSQKKSKRRHAIDDVAMQTTIIGLTTYDCCILGCMLLNVSTKGSIAAFETMGIAYANSSFAILPAEAGMDVAACGTIGVISLLSMGWFSAHFSDVQLIVGGMLVMVVGILSLTLIGDDPEANANWRFVFAIFMLYSIGYPIGHTALLGLFSKIVGRRPQGTLMGWFASAGSLARIAFPVMSGYVASMDIKNLFFILSSILSASALFVVMNRKKLTLLSS